MFSAVHTIVFAHDAERARAFFRDVLRWPHVDGGDGWLLFGTGPSELGVHPTSADEGSWSTAPHHQIALMCEDVEAAVVELSARGVRFTAGVQDEGFGLTATFEVPGAGDMMIYQPRHPVAYDRS